MDIQSQETVRICAQVLSRKVSPTSCIRPAGKLCRSPSVASPCRSLRAPSPCRSPRAPSPCGSRRMQTFTRSPCSIDCKCVGISSKPTSPWNLHSCDNRLCSSSEPYVSKVSSAHEGMCSDSRNQVSPSGPPTVWERLRTNMPNMDPAGIITRNYAYPYPPEMHSIIRLDSSLKHLGLYEKLGKLTDPTFYPQVGDVMIVKCPRDHITKDNGYVAFYTHGHEKDPQHMCPGDLLLRFGRFMDGNVWHYNKRYKLYQLTDEHRWLLIGMVDNFVDLQPLTKHKHSRQNIDRHCRFFVPRRGDLVAHLHAADNASQLAWFTPKTKNDLNKGDIVIRVCMGDLLQPDGCAASEVEAQVEIYMYTGKGFSWIYMGRDDCWLKDGVDVKPRPPRPTEAL